MRNFGSMSPRDAAILLGVDAANSVIEAFKKDKGNMGVDSAEELVGNAIGDLIDEANNFRLLDLQGIELGTLHQNVNHFCAGFWMTEILLGQLFK